MIRYIKIEDSNKRDAELTFKSINSGNKVFLALESGEKPTNKKVIKSSQNNSLENLINEKEITQEHYNQFSEILISDNKEIDFELFGKFIGKTDKIYTTNKFKPVFNVSVSEQIINPDGDLVEERKPNYLESNINGLNTLKWTNKYIPKNKLYNKVVLSSKYQIKHVNGLTFDFLFNMAKDLHEKKSFMMIGGGKGNEPIILNDGGKPFRGFLEGRIEGDSYCLILHLSNQEFKGI